MHLKQGYRVIILVVLIWIISWLAKSTNFADNIYVHYIFPLIHAFLATLSYSVPFSLGEVFYSVLIITILYTIIKHIKSLKKFEGWLALAEQFVWFGCVLYLFFLVFWGINYYRTPVYKLEHVSDQILTSQDYAAAAVFLAQLDDSLLHIKSFQKEWRPNDSAPWASLMPKIKKVTVKYSLSSTIEDFLGVEGYYNPFSAEGQVPSTLPSTLMPFVKAHEAAHIYGVASESDANWCAYEWGFSAQNNKLKASTCFNVLIYVLRDLKMKDSVMFTKTKQSLPDSVRRQIESVKKYYKSHESPIDNLTRIIFSNFLKANGQPKGIESYNTFTAWVVNDLKRKNLLKPL